MKATLLIMAQAEAELQELTPRDLRAVVEFMDFLCDYPRAAQIAGFTDAPDVRRGVVRGYMIYYRYDPARNSIRVYTVRHGRRKPIKADDLPI